MEQAQDSPVRAKPIGTVDFIFQCCTEDPDFTVDECTDGRWVAACSGDRCMGSTALEALTHLAWSRGYDLRNDMREFAALCHSYVEEWVAV